MARVGNRKHFRRVGQQQGTNANANGLLNARQAQSFNGLMNAAQGMRGNGTVRLNGELTPQFGVNGVNGSVLDNFQEFATEIDDTNIAETSQYDLDNNGTTDVETAVGTDDQGNTILFGSIDTNGDGVDDVEVAIKAPAVQPAPQEQDVCSFPAQQLGLRRTVFITNTTPQITNVDTDVCGNVISYTEEMTRQMQASEWTPVSGLEAGVNGVANLVVNGQGRVVSEQNPNLRFANSLNVPSFGNGVTSSVNTSAGRVGARRTAVKNNANAAFGVGAMRKFRGA